MTSCSVRRLSSFVCTPPIHYERWERYLNRGEGYRKLKDKSRKNSGNGLWERDAKYEEGR